MVENTAAVAVDSKSVCCVVDDLEIMPRDAMSAIASTSHGTPYTCTASIAVVDSVTASSISIGVQVEGYWVNVSEYMV